MNTATPRLRLAAVLFGAATLAVVSATVLAPNAARAQTAVTDPVGYLSIPLPANSDTFVSIPFTRPAEFTGAVASVSGGTITLSGTPGFTANGFAPLGAVAPNDGHKTYYVIIGPKNVALTPTLSVTNASATATASAALPTDLLAGDTVTVAGYTFTVSAVSGTTLTLDRVYPGTTASGQAATYNHSPSEGRFYTVTTNDAGSLTVNLNGDSLANVTAGTQVSVIPYWTLGTTFPATDAGNSFFASSSPLALTMELLFPDYATPGTNIPPAFTYFFYNGAWRQFGQSIATSYDDTVMLPDGFITVRNNTTNAANFKPIGSVLTKRETVVLGTQSNKKQDNFVSLIRPVPVSLKDSGLINSGAFVASTSPLFLQDELYVYNNNAPGQRKAPTATYFVYNNAWRLFGNPITEDHGADIAFGAGVGTVIRKNSSTTTSFWVNAPTY